MDAPDRVFRSAARGAVPTALPAAMILLDRYIETVALRAVLLVAAT